jgi:hypothetical protein
VGRSCRDQPGGSIDLDELADVVEAAQQEVTLIEGYLDRYGDDIEADFQRYYRVDVRDLWRGDLTHRRALVLLRKLPAESATMTTMRDALTPEQIEAAAGADDGDTRYGQWSHESMLMARVVDEVAMLRYVLLAVNTSADSKRPPLPDPVPRPGVRRRNRGPAPRAVAYLQQLIARHEEAVADGG